MNYKCVGQQQQNDKLFFFSFLTQIRTLVVSFISCVNRQKKKIISRNNIAQYLDLKYFENSLLFVIVQNK